MDKNIYSKAVLWTKMPFDTDTINEVKALIENDNNDIVDSFYKDLEFGTGGLRGVLGAGTNRMNIYTVGMATQGLANYLIKSFPNTKIKVAIAFDCRNMSDVFAQTAANILSANNIKVYLFDSLRPTPQLSYILREYNCKSGIVITASHNPKEYNGFKAYWEDGGQLIAPHDTNVIEEVRKVEIKDIKFDKNDSLIEIIGEKEDEMYLDMLSKLSLNKEIIKQENDLSIVYTPLHGTGVKLVPKALKRYGFTNIFSVAEQNITDGNFPTVKSPNPEESEALKMALELADIKKSDLVMATDPDGDRVGIAVRNTKGKLELLNGNQTASIIIYYLLSQWKKNNKLNGNQYIVKTIVTSEILRGIAESFDVKLYDVLTGFKFIADKIKHLEGIEEFIGGGEESYGYLVGDKVRDKDAVISCCIIAECAAWAKSEGKTLYRVLQDIYLEYGFYKEKLISVVKKGQSGAEEIKAMMDNFRNTPPLAFAGSEIVCIKDFKKSTDKNLNTNTEIDIDLPKSNVLQYITKDGTVITVRPSGTEPKIKYYVSAKTNLDAISDYEKQNTLLYIKLETIERELLEY